MKDKEIPIKVVIGKDNELLAFYEYRSNDEYQAEVEIEEGYRVEETTIKLIELDDLSKLCVKLAKELKCKEVSNLGAKALD